MTTSLTPSSPPFSRSAALYDLLYRDKPYRVEAEAVQQHLVRPAIRDRFGGLLLVELGCGTGNFLSEFQGLGWNVTGVDANDAMAELARLKGHDAVTADMAGPPEQLISRDQRAVPFDAACSLFASFSYATVDPKSVDRVLRNTRELVGVGGRFVFDVVNYAAACSRLTRYSRREVHGEPGYSVERLMWKHHDPDRGIVEARCQFREQRPECPAEEWEELHRLRAFTPPEIRAAVGQAGGWREIAIFGTGFRDITESPCVGVGDYYFMVVLEAC